MGVFTYKMAAKINRHRYGTKLRHCHPMYTVYLHTYYFRKAEWLGSLHRFFDRMGTDPRLGENRR